MDEDHFPSATSKSNPAPLKFPNRVKTAISHNEYCLRGQVFLTLTNAPQVVYDWLKELGKNAKDVPVLTRIGRPPKKDETLMAKIHGIVEQPNKKGAANSTNIVRNRLEQEHGHPRMFLKESYCHLDHTAPARWIIPGMPVAEPGWSPLLIIFAAFVVWYDKDRQKLRSKFVDESVYIWPSIGKSHKKSGRAPKNHFDKEVWNDVPPELKVAGIYLQGMSLNNCRSHLGSASYHFHKTAAKPADNAKLEDLREWATGPDVKAWLDKKKRHFSRNPRRKDIEPHVKAYFRESTWTIYALSCSDVI
ncbi:hypothetical protein BGZ47_008853 [Haplosporangium gracile]|nr:hypothetical protein BGZ47_008853 [Haplosporangium gracile]